MSEKKIIEWSGERFSIYIRNGIIKETKDIKRFVKALQPTIKNIAYKNWKKTGIEIDDLVQLLNFETLNMLVKWKPDKSKFSTYWYSYLIKRCADEIERCKSGYCLPVGISTETDYINGEEIKPKNILRMS